MTNTHTNTVSADILAQTDTTVSNSRAIDTPVAAPVTAPVAANDTLTFESLNLIGPLLGALRSQGFNTPTPIQAQAIPPMLEGRDVLGIAQTGTGKTAAFALPILQFLADQKGKPAPRTARVLILSPTRELAGQINDSIAGFASRLRLSQACVFGGVGKGPQARICSRGVDILVATPGRLRDLMEDGAISLQAVQILVLDEADRMLDMGFAPEVRRFAKTMPADRQTVLFSATMPTDIRVLANELMRDPVRVEVTPQSTTVERIAQKVMFVERSRKAPLLRQILSGEDVGRVIVFTRTKRGADKVSQGLKADGISAAVIHGDKTQGARKQALADFTRGRVAVMVATDLAARGIDVEGITHVINFDLPVDAESYVHRIGRTARAGASGIALSFCAPDEADALQAIQKLTRTTIPVDDTHPYHAPEAAAAALVRSNAVPQGRGKPSRGRGAGPKPYTSGPTSNNGPKRSGKPFRAKPGNGAPRKSGEKSTWVKNLNDRG